MCVILMWQLQPSAGNMDCDEGKTNLLQQDETQLRLSRISSCSHYEHTAALLQSANSSDYGSLWAVHVPAVSAQRANPGLSSSTCHLPTPGDVVQEWRTPSRVCCVQAASCRFRVGNYKSSPLFQPGLNHRLLPSCTAGWAGDWLGPQPHSMQFIAGMLNRWVITLMKWHDGGTWYRSRVKVLHSFWSWFGAKIWKF